MTRWLVAMMAATVSMTLGAKAAIPVGATGSALWTFDALPSATAWSTRSIGNASGDYSGASAIALLDSAVQTVGPSDITNALTSSTGNPPGSSAAAVWSTNGYVQTRVANNGAALLMASLSNSIGTIIMAFDVHFDFSIGVTSTTEEIPGHRIYYSLFSSPNGWVAITNISTVGPKTFTVILSGSFWYPGSVVYLLFADDNATINPDGAYQIDNFVITNVLHGDPTCLGIASHPQSITVPERGPAIFSVMATGTPQQIQWYRSDNGGVSYTAIAGATATNYLIPSAAYPPDNGAKFRATVSNIVCAATSTAATLTVTPDSTAPVVLRAVGQLDPTIITVTFSEAINSAALSPDSFTLFETGSDPATSPYASYFTALTNGTNVTLITDPREAGRNYSLLIEGVVDDSFQHNPIATTNVLLRQTIQLIGFDTDNVWQYDVNNGDRFGTGWETVDYDDSAWPSGPAGLGFENDTAGPAPGNNGVPIRTMIAYSGNSVPVYFRKHFTWPAGTNDVVLKLQDVAEDAAVYFINGQEVFRHNVAPGALTFATRSAVAQQDPTPIMGPFILPATALVSGDNVMAVVVFQTGAASGDIEMAAELTAEISQYPPWGLIIRTQPQSQTVDEGASVGLSVVAEGQVPIYYQWRKGGFPIPAKTDSVFTIPSATPSDSGTYDVIITNSFASVTSALAVVTIRACGALLLKTSQNLTNGQVTIQWSGCASGTLQETTDLLSSGTIWTDVPGNPNPYASTPSGRRFFRVKP